MPTTYPKEVKFYRRGTGEIQFKLSPPKEESNGTSVKISEGCVYVEIAPANGDKTDWAKSMKMKLSAKNLAQIRGALDKGRFLEPGRFLISHTSDPNGQISFDVKPGTKIAGTYMLSMRRDKDGQVESVTMYIDEAEAEILVILFGTAIARIYGWQSSGLKAAIVESISSARDEVLKSLRWMCIQLGLGKKEAS